MTIKKPDVFERIGSIDSNKYLSFLKERYIDWDGKFNQMHNREIDFKSVLAFPIVDEFYELDYFDEFIKISDDLLDILCNKYGRGKFYKIHFSRMTKNSVVNPHIDCGLGFTFSHRIHLPLQTSDNNFLIIEDEKIIMKTNQLVEINNLKTHTVEVNSDFERIHLILDFMTDDIIKYFNF
jgi:hypothetical protein